MRISLALFPHGALLLPAMGRALITALPLINRGNRWILQKTFDGKQRQVPLGKDKKIAETRAKRFLLTAEVNGFECALEELKGKAVLKRGEDPTFEQMKELYQDYLRQSGKIHDPRTIQTNLNRLRNVMDKLKAPSIGKIDKNKIFRAWFGDAVPTPSQRRTFSSAMRAAASVFKVSAMAYYASRGQKFKNPFLGLELSSPKVEAYHPISEDLRKAIWEDCQTELPPHQAMIVIMALGIGMRREEIEAATSRWLSAQKDKAIIHIQEEQEFIPKAGESGQVPFSRNTYEILMRLRGNSDSKYIVPYSEKKPTNRLFTPATKVCEWLRAKGLDRPKPLQTLRQELGSHVAKQHGILEASKILRNDPQVCAIHYAGIAETHTVDMGGSFGDQASLEEQFAKTLGLSVRGLREKLKLTPAQQS